MPDIGQMDKRERNREVIKMVYYIVGAILLLWFLGGLSRRLRRRNKVIHIVEDNCTGCKCCTKRCHRQVLDLAGDETGKHVVVKHPDKCTACGDCVKACKFNALELLERINNI
ncbi:ferredoxin [Bacteroidales bacterium Barb6]|nr:ferredoxin [Bacteroidales bacterium Barb6]